MTAKQKRSLKRRLPVVHPMDCMTLPQLQERIDQELEKTPLLELASEPMNGYSETEIGDVPSDFDVEPAADHDISPH